MFMKFSLYFTNWMTYFIVSYLPPLFLTLKNRVTDPDGVDPEPDPNAKKKSNPDPRS